MVIVSVTHTIHLQISVCLAPSSVYTTQIFSRCSNTQCCTAFCIIVQQCDEHARRMSNSYRHKCNNTCMCMQTLKCTHTKSTSNMMLWSNHTTTHVQSCTQPTMQVCLHNHYGSKPVSRLVSWSFCQSDSMSSNQLYHVQSSVHTLKCVSISVHVSTRNCICSVQAHTCASQ